MQFLDESSIYTQSDYDKDKLKLAEVERQMQELKTQMDALYAETFGKGKPLPPEYQELEDKYNGLLPDKIVLQIQMDGFNDELQASNPLSEREYSEGYFKAQEFNRQIKDDFIEKNKQPFSLGKSIFSSSVDKVRVSFAVYWDGMLDTVEDVLPQKVTLQIGSFQTVEFLIPQGDPFLENNFLGRVEFVVRNGDNLSQTLKAKMDYDIFNPTVDGYEILANGRERAIRRQIGRDVQDIIINPTATATAVFAEGEGYKIICSHAKKSRNLFKAGVESLGFVQIEQIDPKEALLPNIESVLEPSIRYAIKIANDFESCEDVIMFSVEMQNNAEEFTETAIADLTHDACIKRHIKAFVFGLNECLVNSLYNSRDNIGEFSKAILSEELQIHDVVSATLREVFPEYSNDKISAYANAAISMIANCDESAEEVVTCRMS